MEFDYDTTRWSERTTLGRRVFNYNYRMLGRELPEWSLVKAVPMRHVPSVAETAYLWHSQRSADRELVRVTVAALDHWREAQGFLAETLSHRMRANIPEGTGVLAQLGDVNFVARVPRSDLAGAISFARGNVVVSVHSAGQV